ncbi:MAG: hypothetical protein L6416_01030, partial [Candidatus Omnitrophica bacterium]|nr:hypothetical protein [Candidatus Omnitrophota bacterium]
MLYFKGQPKKSTTNISGKMSLYSALSIITIIIICAAAWNLLDIAKNTYLKTIKGTHTAPPKQRTTITKTYQQTSL